MQSCLYYRNRDTNRNGSFCSCLHASRILICFAGTLISTMFAVQPAPANTAPANTAPANTAPVTTLSLRTPDVGAQSETDLQYEKLLTLLRSNPREGVVFDRVVNWHAERGTFAEFARSIRRECAANSSKTECWLLLGLIEKRSGNREAAISAFQNAEGQDPAAWIPVLERARLLRTTDPHRAIQGYRGAIVKHRNMLPGVQGDQERQRIALELVELLLSRFRNSEAADLLRELRRELEVSSKAEVRRGSTDQQRLLEQLAPLFAKSGATAEAVELYEILRIRADNASQQFRWTTELVSVLSDRGEHVRAVDLLKTQLLSFHAGSPECLQTVQLLDPLLLRQSGLHGGPDGISEGLLAFYRAKVEEEPATVFWRKHLAELLYSQQQYSESIAQLQLAIESDPDNPDLRILLGNANYQLHDKDQAKRSWEFIAEGSRRSPESLIRLSEIYQQHGEVEESIRCLREACLENVRPSIRQRLAKLLVDSGMQTEAAQQLTKALETEKNRTERQRILIDLVQIFQQAGQLEGKITELRTRINVRLPGQPDAGAASAGLMLAECLMAVDSVDSNEVAELAVQIIGLPESSADDWLNIADRIARTESKAAIRILQAWSNRENTQYGMTRLAQLLDANSQPEAAIQTLWKLSAGNLSRSDQISVIQNLADIASRSGQFAEVIEDIEHWPIPDASELTRAVNVATAAIRADEAEMARAVIDAIEIPRGRPLRAVDRAEFERLASLAEQAGHWTRAAELYEHLESTTILVRIPRRSVSVRTRHADIDELIDVYLPEHGDLPEVQDICEITDLLLKNHRRETAIQFLSAASTLAESMPTKTNDWWRVRIREAALHWMTGDRNVAKREFQTLAEMSGLAMSGPGAGAETEPEPVVEHSDDQMVPVFHLEAEIAQDAAAASRFALWLSSSAAIGNAAMPQNSSATPDDASPFAETPAPFPDNLRRAQTAALAFCLLELWSASEQNEAGTKLLSTDKERTPAQWRDVDRWYFTIRSLQEVGGNSVQLPAELRTMPSEAQVANCPLMFATMLADSFEQTAIDPDALVSRDASQFELLSRNPGILQSDYPESLQRVPQWLEWGLQVHGYSSESKGQGNYASRHLPHESDQTKVSTAMSNSARFRRNTAGVQLREAALGKERLGDSKGACDLYLQLLSSHREEFITEFETLLQGFESAHREGDLADALTQSGVRDFAETADAVMQLAVRMSRNAVHQTTGRKLLEQVLRDFPEHQLRYLAFANRAEVISDDVFARDVMQNLLGIRKQPTSLWSPWVTGAYATLSREAEDRYLSSDFFGAFSELNHRQSETLAEQLKTSLEADPQWTGGALLSLFLETARGAQVTDESEGDLQSQIDLLARTIGQLTGSDDNEKRVLALSLLRCERLLDVSSKTGNRIDIRQDLLLKVLEIAVADEIRDIAEYRLGKHRIETGERSEGLKLIEQQVTKRLKRIELRGPSATATPGELLGLTRLHAQLEAGGNQDGASVLREQIQHLRAPVQSTHHGGT
ncbi:MAG: tetratricopeptide repeat protein [Planctomyces sp.]|nr:tetratricopeptide repeat protein [Planctomyces sp.]